MNVFVRICLALMITIFGNAAMAAERMMPAAVGKSGAALMKTAQEKGTIKVIVGFRRLLRTGRQTQDRRCQRAARRHRPRHCFSPVALRGRDPAQALVLPQLQVHHQLLIEVTPEELDRLSKDPLVASITVNGVAKTQLIDSVPMIRANGGTHVRLHRLLARPSRSSTRASTRHTPSSPDGSWRRPASPPRDKACPGGVTSSDGARVRHALPRGLRARHACGRDHCRQETARPRASLREPTSMAIQVFNRSGSGATTADIIAGLEYVYSRRNDFSIAAVNLSLGGGRGVTPTNASSEDPAHGGRL